MSEDAWSNLDKVDQKIIEILNNNARTPSKEIASELKKSGHDVSDRTIRKRIERLEKSGIIKGYKAVLTDVSGINEYQAVLMKLKPSKSLEAVKDSIKAVHHKTRQLSTHIKYGRRMEYACTIASKF